ncbi:M1-specific T cell receptor beta chain isoform X1 [Fundulus heteroclitus]|uniref:M1-specific T cell receptor beta chain isoform X1 n=1 Tax=Fundulus heteroclitus TaxID=8078 RepID=UPI00165B63CA|nr:M1-specific T cell receptor beta chain isoform X1 [Fundulus heteroclitus]
MTPSGFVFFLMCVLLWKKAKMNQLETAVHQEGGFISADVGGNVSLQCSYGSEAARYYWYKQSLGQKLQLMSISNKFDTSGTFQDKFKDPRFTLITQNGKSNLNISDLKPSDTGTYFCASGVSFVFEFGEGVTVSVKDSALENVALVRQSESETLQAGSSVTLNCTVQAGSCSGEHNVYWFRNSGESAPGLIFTHGGRNDQCEKNSNTQTLNCMYNLPIRNLNNSHVGTYYCAVASCGRVLFGNGTKLDLKSEAFSLFLVYFLSAALIFTAILTVLLAFTLHKMHKRNSCQPSVFKARLSFRPATNAEGHQDPDSLHYAAVDSNQLNRSRRNRKSTETECVYSTMMQ